MTKDGKGFKIMAERIRMMRQAKSLTQEELASRAGLTKGFISQVGNNLTSLSVESLLVTIFGIHLNSKASTFFEEGIDEKIVFGAGNNGSPSKGRRQRKVKRSSCLTATTTGSWTPRFWTWVQVEKKKEEEPHESEEFGFVVSEKWYQGDSRREDVNSSPTR